jgi:hypothetical protein
MKFKTAGYSVTNNLHFSPGPSHCGRVKDGVVLEHDNEGGWLLAFKDLEKMYLAAKAARSSRGAAGSQSGEKP